MRGKRPPNRDIEEWRRLRAVELDRLGWREVDIAEALGVHKGTVSRWLAVTKEKGPSALLAHVVTGHPPKLTDEQKHLIPEFLSYFPHFTFSFSGNFPGRQVSRYRSFQTGPANGEACVVKVSVR